MSFYTSLTGVKAAQTDLEVISHNLANAETSGFKRSSAKFADLVPSSVLTDPRQTVGIGTRLASVDQIFKQGPIEQTGAALDLAISGDGFFSTKDAVTGKVMYTRNGSFSVDEAGFIERGAGQRMQIFAAAADGSVNPAGPTADAQILPMNGTSPFAGVTVDDTGMIVASYADGSQLPVGRVALATFIAPTGLKQMGSSNWTPTGLSGPASFGVPGDGRFAEIMSGSIERSNVDITEELVGLITAQRNFQANAKAIDTASQITQTIIGIRT